MTDGSRQATALALVWAITLVVLAALWVRSPFLGERAAFVIWSGPAAVLLVATARWIRTKGIQEVPDGPLSRLTVGVLWLVALWLTATDLGRSLALDGLIMREPGLRLFGQLLRWTPLAFGCCLSLAGLAAALEARYRLINGPRKPAMPQA